MCAAKNPNSPSTLTEFAPHDLEARPSGGFFSRLFGNKPGNVSVTVTLPRAVQKCVLVDYVAPSLNITHFSAIDFFQYVTFSLL